MLKPATKLKLRRAAAELMYRSGGLELYSHLTSERWRILTYHRIVNPRSVPYPLQPGMYVTPEVFRLHMKRLRDGWNVVPLRELVKEISSGNTIDNRTVAVTFDDGWIDNYTNAFAVIKEFNIPTSIFIATSFVGTGELFWTDKLQVAVGAFLRISDGVRTVERLIAAIKERSGAESFPAVLLTKLFTTDGEPTSSRLEYAIELLKTKHPEERRDFVEQIWRTAKEFVDLRIPPQFMGWDEVREMASAGIEFGSHAHRHYNASQLSPDQFRDEIINSYAELRRNKLNPLDIFCFPGGYHSTQNMDVLKKEGIKSALLAGKDSDFSSAIPLFGRIHLHNDVVGSVSEFETKLLLTPPF